MFITINLDESFTPFGGYVPNFWKFPAGEVGVRVDEIPVKNNEIEIVARLTSSEEIIKLLMLTDAIKQQKPTSIKLFVSYLPYARQDRIMINGEGFSLKVMANLINSQEYSEVKVFDPHSNASGILIDNMVEVKNYKFVSQIINTAGDYTLISPDFGASKKIDDLAKYLNYTKEIIQATKVRDLATGKIVKYSLPESSVVGTNCVIVDDICSKGGTFMMLAAQLKRMWAKSVTLIVSHFEDTADRELLKKDIDLVFTTNSVKNVKDCPLVKCIGIDRAMME